MQAQAALRQADALKCKAGSSNSSSVVQHGRPQYAGLLSRLPVAAQQVSSLSTIASTATAAARKQVAGFTAVQENIEEKELHVEASESYLAVCAAFE